MNTNTAHQLNLSPEHIKNIEVSINDMFEEAFAVSSDERVLDSTNEVLSLVRRLVEQRGVVSAERQFVSSGLISLLMVCRENERNLDVFGKSSLHSPAVFMREMEEGKHLGLAYKDILEHKKQAEMAFNDFAASLEEQVCLDELDDKELSEIKDRLEHLAGNLENYAFVEQTHGFFCKEVLSAYNAHLIEVYDSCFFSEADSEVCC